MADDGYNLFIRIKVTSDDAALNLVKQQLGDVSAKIKDTGAAAKEATGLFGSLKAGIGELAATIGGLFALGEIIRFLHEGATAAAGQERALQQLRNTVAQFGGNAEEAAGKAEALAKALQRKGFSDDETIAAVRTVTIQTHDYEQALWAASLAADMSAKSGASYGVALNTIQDLLAGRQRSVIQAHKEFGTTATTVQGNIDQLDQMFGGYVNTLHDTKSAMDAAKEELVDFGKELGGPINEAILFIIKAIKSLGIAVSGVGLGAYYAGDMMVQSFQAAAKGLASIDWRHPFNGISQAAKDAFAAAQKTLGEATDAFDAWADRSSSLLSSGGGVPRVGTKGKAGAGAGTGTGGAGGATENKDLQSSVQDLAKAYQDLKGAETQEAMAAYQNAESKPAMAEAAKKVLAALNAEQAGEKALLEVQRAQKIAAAKGNAEAVLNINKEFDIKQEILDKQYQAKRDALDKDHLQKITDIDEQIKKVRDKNRELEFQNAQRDAARYSDLEKKRQDTIDHYNKVRVNAERNLYNQLIGLASQYGGKSIQQVVQIVQAVDQLYQLWQTIETIFFAKKQVQEATAAVLSQTTTKASDVGQGTENANLWAINAAASVAAIPYIGWAMAPEVYMAALAQGMAGVAAIAAVPIVAAREGYDIPAGIEPLIHAHEREMVLPREQADVIRSLAARPSSMVHDRRRGGDVIIHQNLLSGARGDYAAREVAKEVRKGERMLLRSTPARRLRQQGSTRDYTRRAQ